MHYSQDASLKLVQRELGIGHKHITIRDYIVAKIPYRLS